MKNMKAGISNHFVVVSSRSYGNALKGTKIYYEGKKPKGLKKDGSITFGKHILELLKRKYGKKYRWVISQETDSIANKYNISRVLTSQKTLAKMNNSLRERTRDIKNDIVAKTFADVYPNEFSTTSSAPYVAGTLSHLLKENILSRLSTDDHKAINNFLPDYIAAEALNAVSVLKASAQIKTLKGLSKDFKQALDGAHSENWWQDYVKNHILIIQQGYIKAIEKMNVAIGNSKYPDFMLVTHDNYLDILEIKKPDTELIKEDKSRNNYYWSQEVAKAIIQVENYIEYVQHHADAVRNYIRDTYGIELKVIRPRGIILVGNSKQFTDQKQSDDYRLLSLSAKNITFVTYDELLSRLENYIKVLEDSSKTKITRRSRQKLK